jgi:hypothetical protein
MSGEAAEITDIYVWNDRARTAYARLRRHAGHLRVEWGRRDPPGGEREMESGRHLTSDPTEALAHLVASIRGLSDDPDDAMRAERALRAALRLPPAPAPTSERPK